MRRPPSRPQLTRDPLGDAMRASRHRESWFRRSLRKVAKWLTYQVRVRQRPIVTVAGVQLRVGRHMSPQVERAVSRGLYEQDELHLLGEVLSPGDVVLELGAGIGLVSAYCAKRIRSSRVFAYEANPDLEPRIRETYWLNQVRPTLEMCAIGAQTGTVTLYCGRHLWSSSILRPTCRVRPVEVPMKALSEIAREIRPTLLIVDVEGAEGELFDHAHLPTVMRIVLELHERVIGATNAGRVRSRLAAIGFEELPELSAGEHLTLRRVSGRGSP